MNTSSLNHSPNRSPNRTAERQPSDAEFLLAEAGIGFEVIHEGPGSDCQACPQGLDLAA